MRTIEMTAAFWRACYARRYSGLSRSHVMRRMLAQDKHYVSKLISTLIDSNDMEAQLIYW